MQFKIFKLCFYEEEGWEKQGSYKLTIVIELILIYISQQIMFGLFQT